MRTVIALLLLTGGAADIGAQGQRPRAELAPSPASTVAPGSTAKVTLTVRLPKDVHVQADQPRDPSLIATSLTVTPPDGITVQSVRYPRPDELAQTGRSEPLLVLGPEFVIDVTFAAAATAPRGDLTIPARLRYQACNDSVCFPPATATAEWTLTVK